jgi:hypothetical protein
MEPRTSEHSSAACQLAPAGLIPAKADISNYITTEFNSTANG